MKRNTWLGLLMGLFLLSPTTQAASGWISDVLYVPMRAGAGSEYRIVHRGLKSGTRIEVLEQTEGSEWVKVRYGDIDGFIAAQYVSLAPTSAITLAQVRGELESAQSELSSLREQLSAVTRERNQLATENSALQGNLNENQSELAHLQDVAAEPIRLDQANRELNEELSRLRTELDALNAENSMLLRDNRTNQWLVGALILVVGWVAGFLLKGRGGRNRGSWV